MTKPLVQIDGVVREMNDEEYAVWQAQAAQREQEQAETVRAERNRRLADSDWRVMKAAEVGMVLDPAWIIHRQELRDVPNQSGFPWNVTWPVPPS